MASWRGEFWGSIFKFVYSDGRELYWRFLYASPNPISFAMHGMTELTAGSPKDVDADPVCEWERQFILDPDNIRFNDNGNFDDGEATVYMLTDSVVYFRGRVLASGEWVLLPRLLIRLYWPQTNQAFD